MAGTDFERRMEKMRLEADIENKKQDNTSRSKIANWLTKAFIGIAGVIIIGTPIYNATIGVNTQIDIRGLLSEFGSIFGTALGFVLGYYFKDKGQSQS